MQHHRELIDMADAATRLVQAVSPDPAAPQSGSLTVVGTGIRAFTQLTLEAVAEMRLADVLLHVIGDPVQEELVHALNPAAQSLTHYYSPDLERIHTYEAMITHILAEVAAGRRVVAAFYGHPGVFVYPTHESIRRARATGHHARMLPAVSAEDCLIADLGIDPGDGYHAYEATDFLYRQGPVDASVHLVIWQVGALGDSSGGGGHDTAMVADLARKLGTAYGPGHPVTIYEAPFDPAGVPTIRRVPVAGLARSPIGMASTLYVPPWRSLATAQ